MGKIDPRPPQPMTFKDAWEDFADTVLDEVDGCQREQSRMLFYSGAIALQRVLAQFGTGEEGVRKAGIKKLLQEIDGFRLEAMVRAHLCDIITKVGGDVEDFDLGTNQHGG